MQEMLCVERVSFANIINRDELLEHHGTVVTRDPHGILTRYFQSERRITNGGCFPFAMVASFEHDRRLVLVRFPFFKGRGKKRRSHLSP